MRRRPEQKDVVSRCVEDDGFVGPRRRRREDAEIERQWEKEGRRKEE